jgi:2-polyprenyl-6-methoxyphenol hydroxylase-like FAD-dependent oxidoreductase
MDTQVIVVGAGPVGLMLAGELRLGGAEVTVLERRRRPSTESRASTVHARTMEILDSRGLLGRLGEPPNEPRGHFGGVPLDLTLPSRYPGQWKVPQTRVEELLAHWATGLGADVRREWDLVELAQDAMSVQITADTSRGPRRLRADYLVGCDGEDSTVRELTGAPFPGWPARRELLRADVAGIDIPNRRFQRLAHGLAIAARNKDGVTRVMVHEFGADPPTFAGTPDFGQLVDRWKRVTGEDISGGEPLWVNSFGDANAQLTRYRDGRVLYAGDAAHRQLPAGGQALNLGLQDAVNLGWKLALRVRGRTADELLDTYHAERHAVGARVLANIRAQALLLLGGPEVEPVRTLLGELIGHERVRARLAGTISGLDIRYPVGPDDPPLVGARLPDVELDTPDGPTSTTALLRAGRGLLLDFATGPVAPPERIVGRWSDRVNGVAAAHRVGAGGDPLSDAPAVLVRPDGYVAWIGSPESGLLDALRRWFGPPNAGR